ncbi:MAG: hypothetical protein WA885_14795 [Phormidesmis sp.]
MTNQISAGYKAALKGLGVAVLCFAAPWLSGMSPPTASCYVSEQGTGDRTGTTPDNSLPWESGQGVETCLDRAVAGTTIYVSPGEYTIAERIRWTKSGAPGQPIRLIGAGDRAIEGTFGLSVLAARGQWPTVRGTRPQTYSTDTVSYGSDFIQLAEGVSHIEISNFNLFDFRKVIEADATRNQDVAIANLYVENIRHLLSITAGCEETACTADTSADWRGENLYVLGVSKRVLKAEGLRNSTFKDIYADVKDSNGQMHWDDWPLLFHFTGPSEQILVERTIVKNPVQHTDKPYDNGDCYTAEKHTANLTFRSALCFEAFDAAFDLKGGPHLVEDAIALKIGNRAFRVWDGPVTIKNSLAAYDGYGEYTQSAAGSNAAIWVRGEAIVEGFTSLNSTRPFILDGQNGQCGLLSLSDSLIVLDTQSSTQGGTQGGTQGEGDRTLQPQTECSSSPPIGASVIETNVQYRSEAISTQSTLFNSLLQLSRANHWAASLLNRLLNRQPIGFVWPNSWPAELATDLSIDLATDLAIDEP